MCHNLFAYKRTMLRKHKRKFKVKKFQIFEYVNSFLNKLKGKKYYEVIG